MTMTITEALAEVKTIEKRLVKKRESVMGYLWRQDGLRDPLEKQGGSVAFIASERQAIHDLELRVIAIRRAIQHANDATEVSVCGTTRTISEWLTWRREIAKNEQAFVANIRANLSKTRMEAQRNGIGVTTNKDGAQKPTDIIINVDEQELAATIDKLEETMGALDGQLSLKNATIMIEV